jgi:TRAP-type C4-dicarboxylate transport system substrate-binding protein
MKLTSLGLAAAMAAIAPAAFAQEVTLRLSHWVPATIAPAAAGIEPWARSVEEASDGRIEIQIFPAQQIGAAPDHYDMARDGIADITWVNPGYTAAASRSSAWSRCPSTSPIPSRAPRPSTSGMRNTSRTR